MIALERWLPYRKRLPRARSRVFCFPYAGGSASIFARWPDLLGPDVDLCAVQLPGRESRVCDPLLTSMPAVVEAVTGVLLPLASDHDVFFGTSLGALVAFEVARALRRRGRRIGRLVVAAAAAPQLCAPTSNLSESTDAELEAVLRALGGTSDAALASDELMALVLPIFRADLAVYEGYRYREEAPLECPIAAIGGMDDREVSASALRAWRAQTTARFDAMMLPAGHFLVHSHETVLTRILAAFALGAVRSGAPLVSSGSGVRS